MTVQPFYPIGKPGQRWGDAEIATWRSRQSVQRSYAADVVHRVDQLRAQFDVSEYGRLEYPSGSYPLFAIRSRGWQDDLPVLLVTGGVHGYETSGVHGALQFVETKAGSYAGRVNLLVAPCESLGLRANSPLNANAVDPNRSFHENSVAQESAALMQLVAPVRERAGTHRSARNHR